MEYIIISIISIIVIIMIIVILWVCRVLPASVGSRPFGLNLQGSGSTTQRSCQGP